MTSTKSPNLSLEIIGSTEYIMVSDIKKVPAKVDTGADTSAIWASHITVAEDGILSFTLFGEKSPLYTGEVIKTTDYFVKSVRSSHGDTQIRYRVKLPVVIGGESFITTFTLANRSRNNFPVLIGRHTIENRFLVDVSKTVVERPKARYTAKLNQELKANPFKFHQKYLKKG